MKAEVKHHTTELDHCYKMGVSHLCYRSTRESKDIKRELIVNSDVSVFLRIV